ncbi:hypothetical protein [Nonomuraea typhae]|uniref:hypothetical protein n=1 Tax=Nonomuraea typhae TaxID=2603600 RepID=UPI0012FC7C56|nr:hypothetical protein [Nonomuraea typhae]
MKRETLRRVVRGRLWPPGEEAFEVSSRPGNTAVRRPVEAADVTASRAVALREPYTFLAPGERAFPDKTTARPRGIKRERDPRGVIRAGFPVSR